MDKQEQLYRLCWRDDAGKLWKGRATASLADAEAWCRAHNVERVKGGLEGNMWVEPVTDSPGGDEASDKTAP